jgi:acetyltransferase-like isoleucine patch superfamily enzyme
LSVTSTASSTLRGAARRTYSACVAGILSLRGVRVGRGCEFYGLPRVRIARGASIVLGSGVVMRSGSRSNPFSQGLPIVLSSVRPGAVLRVADGVRISDSTIVCAESIEIGAGTYVGVGVLITDTDAHPACPSCRESRSPAPTAPVRIGDRCFVGARSILLKGTSLRDETCIGAGSVVTGRQDPYSGLLAGAPAHMVREHTACDSHAADDAERVV